MEPTPSEHNYHLQSIYNPQNIAEVGAERLSDPEIGEIAVRWSPSKVKATPISSHQHDCQNVS